MAVEPLTSPTTEGRGDRLPAPSSRAAGPRVSPDEASALPAKLQWTLVGWYRAAGELAAAAALLDRVEARGGESGRLLEERARLAFAAGRVDEATALLTERVERSPSATAWVNLAKLYLEAGDLEAAKAIADDLCREYPDLATVAAFAADVARAAGEYAAARAYHEGVLDARPDNANALLALARIALLEGDRREAGALLERAVAAAGAEATCGQLSVAAGLADLLDKPETGAALRQRALRLDAERSAALARTVDEALGRGDRGGDGAEARGPASPAADPASGASVVRERRPPVDGRAPIRPGNGSSPSTTPSVAPTPTFAPIEAPAEVLVEPRVLETLRRDFGFDGLRPGQAATIANVLAGRDTLAIMPTGAGKSLTFQLPAMLRDGTTLVLSPLIALMKDQVEGLPPAVRERTALLNSSLAPDEQRRVLDGIVDGAYKLVYVAPERLRQHAFLRALRTAGVSLVVVDEAHCISLWGHDFRPDYLAIPSALPELGDPPLLAITATATPAMADAIGAGFGRDLERVRVSVFRPNLFYEAHRVANREEKVQKVLEISRQERGAGIVYVSSRKDAESLAGLLRDRGVGAIPYHAGLDRETRARNQERFMRGQARVVVATVAFGMGVDKADVRFIVHLNPPRSLEAYAQESGRAGRDGRPARCVLLAAPSDQASLTRLARRDELDLDTVRRVYAGVKRAAAGRWALLDPGALLPPPAFDDEAEETADPRVALGLLDQGGLVRRHPDAPVTYAVRPSMADGTPGDDGSEDEATWRRFAAWAGLSESNRSGVTVRTAEACEALGVTPVELARLLGGRSDAVVREGPRLVCLELLPVGNDAGHRLNEIMARAREDASRRIAQVMAYANGGRCRHVMLANHLGEGLEPCGDACDVCAGTATAPSRPARAGAPEDGAAPRRSTTTAGDALAVLEAVRTLPFQMGKTGLTKLLTGSVESRVRADRSPAFGALAGLPKGKVDGLIDRLIEDGYLHRDQNHEFKIVTLTEKGAAATAEDLGDYEDRPRRSPAGGTESVGSGHGPSNGSDAGGELDAEDRALFERLRAWRRERAVQDHLSPAYVASDKTLRELALVRPSTLDRLGRVNGFGPKKVEKYGQEILEIVGGS